MSYLVLLYIREKKEELDLSMNDISGNNCRVIDNKEKKIIN